MRYFQASYTSPGNAEVGLVYIDAEDLVEAQDKFFAYLKTRPVYPHMWKLNLTITEIQEIVRL